MARHRPTPAAAREAVRPNGEREEKQPKNLYLAPDVIARGEEYGRPHLTTLSALVGDFLRALPLDAPSGEASPAVRRLYGIAAGGKATCADHREQLRRKYGGC